MRPILAILFAMPCEAQEIAKKFNIVFKHEYGFTFGINKDLVMIISGVGAIKMACAVGFTHAKFSPIFWLNFGTAGGIDKNIGDLFQIDEIYKNNYIFYPDMLTKSHIKFSSLNSCDKPKMDNANVNLLYDMEGYDFAYATSMFCSIDKIALLKIVSDNCNAQKLTPQFINDLINNKIDDITFFIESFINKKSKVDILDSSSENAILNMASELRLTYAQTMLTINKAKSYARRGILNIDNFNQDLQTYILKSKNKKIGFNEFINKATYKNYNTTKNLNNIFNSFL